MIRADYSEIKAARKKELADADDASLAAFRALTPAPPLEVKDFQSQELPKDFVHPQYDTMTAELVAASTELDQESAAAFAQHFPETPAVAIGAAVINAALVTGAATAPRPEAVTQKIHTQV